MVGPLFPYDVEPLGRSPSQYLSRDRHGKKCHTEVICTPVNGRPTMILFRQARLANIVLAFEQRTIFPEGLSCIKWINSWRSIKTGFVYQQTD